MTQYSITVPLLGVVVCVHVCSASGKPNENFGGVFEIWEHSQGNHVGSQNRILGHRRSCMKEEGFHHTSQSQLHDPLRADKQRVAPYCHMGVCSKVSPGLQL